MAKATLTSMSMSWQPLDNFSIRDMEGREVTEIHGPITYTYNLTYVAYEPLNMSDFPPEINTEDDVCIVEKTTKEPIAPTTEKPQVKMPKTNSAIQYLEVSEATT